MDVVYMGGCVAYVMPILFIYLFSCAKENKNKKKHRSYRARAKAHEAYLHPI